MAKAEIVKGEKKLQARAEQLDREIRSEWQATKHSLSNMGKMFNQMEHGNLWQHLKRSYRTFWHYVVDVTGEEMARGKLFQVMRVHGLTEGENAIPAEEVDKMGVTRAYELTKLEPKHRTPDVVKRVAAASIPKAKEIVQERINAELPEKDRKEPLILFSRNLPMSVVTELEELELDAMGMEGIRDGDFTTSQRVKAWTWFILMLRQQFAEELAEGHKYRLAMEHKEANRAEKAKPSKKHAAAEDEEDAPPDQVAEAVVH